MSKKSKRVRRVFTDEFKQDAVNLVVNTEDNGKGFVAQLACPRIRLNRSPSASGITCHHIDTSAVIGTF